MINAMHGLMVGVFKHLEITSKLDLDIMIKYMECILIVPVQKILQVLI